MAFDSTDGGEDGGYNDIDFAEISILLAVYGAFVFGEGSLNKCR